MLLQNASVRYRVSPSMAACLALACWCPHLAAAATPWHSDLAGARSAAAANQRPVLALFVASWSEESRAVATALQADAEVEALLSTCFEPVVLDVDGDPELTRRLEISHVPTAVVLDAGDRKLAAFECPKTMPAFIAAAAQAVRDVATQTAAVNRDHDRNRCPIGTRIDFHAHRQGQAALRLRRRRWSKRLRRRFPAGGAARSVRWGFGTGRPGTDVAAGAADLDR
jgi:hypothetical protein